MHFTFSLFIETKQNFDWSLHNHLLAWILGCDFNGSNDHLFTNKDRASIHFNHGRIYKHKTARINFTTYDMRWEQDSINPRTEHQDIMVLAHEDASCEEYHPYWYARVVEIFHADVYHIGENQWQMSLTKWIFYGFIGLVWMCLTEVDGRLDDFIKSAFSTVKMSGHFAFWIPIKLFKLFISFLHSPMASSTTFHQTLLLTTQRMNITRSGSIIMWICMSNLLSITCSLKKHIFF